MGTNNHKNMEQDMKQTKEQIEQKLWDIAFDAGIKEAHAERKAQDKILIKEICKQAEQDREFVRKEAQAEEIEFLKNLLKDYNSKPIVFSTIIEDRLQKLAEINSPQETDSREMGVRTFPSKGYHDVTRALDVSSEDTISKAEVLKIIDETEAEDNEEDLINPYERIKAKLQEKIK